MKVIALFLLASALVIHSPISLAGEESAFHTSPDSDALEWSPCPEFFAEGCGIAVLNIDEDGRNADVFFRYPAGESFVNHWHTSAERILVVRGTLEVTYEGQETATVQPGEYAFGPPAHKHHGACRSDEDCLLFIAFEDPPDTFEVAASE